MRRSGQDPQLSPWLSNRNHVHPAVHRVQDEISRDPVRSRSRSELAAPGHVSERHLARLFREHAGASVGEYQRRLRVAHAQRLLQDARMTVERGAELAGFGSARDRRRAWRRHAGGTPSGRADAPCPGLARTSQGRTTAGVTVLDGGEPRCSPWASSPESLGRSGARRSQMPPAWPVRPPREPQAQALMGP